MIAEPSILIEALLGLFPTEHPNSTTVAFTLAITAGSLITIPGVTVLQPLVPVAVIV